MLVVESRVSSNNKKKNENHDTQRYCRDSSKYVSAILFDYYFFYNTFLSYYIYISYIFSHKKRSVNAHTLHFDCTLLVTVIEC